MSEQILSAVHGVTTMLFGIYCSAFFLGIKPIRKNILTMFLLFSGQGLLYVIDLALFGETLANMSYPLIVHFPLVLFLSVHYKYKFSEAFKKEYGISPTLFRNSPSELDVS